MVQDSNDTATHAPALAALQRRFDRWFMDQALPLWAARSVHDSGGFVEALGFDGAPVMADHARVRVQARQIIVFAAAHQAGWAPAHSRALVAAGLSFLLAACRRDDGLFGRVVDLRIGALADPTADLYDTAFGLLALAQARRVLGAPVEADIAGLLAAIDQHLKLPSGRGYREALPWSGGRAQNPHMHLAEALLAVVGVTHGRMGMAQLDALFKFIDAAFFEAEAGWVKERTDGDGRPLEQAFEPGHSFEWIWLLGQRMALMGGAYHGLQQRLYRRALAASAPNGAVVMKAALDGKAIDATMRLWSQTEALRAHLEIAKGPDAALADTARWQALHCGTGILDDWLSASPVAGGWLDHVDAAGALLAKDMPASSFYHIVGAVQALGEFAGPQPTSPI